MVELRDVSIEYRSGRGGAGAKVIRAASEIDVAFASGAISAIVGPSGCGKTSLVHAMAGLLRPACGAVAIDGMPVLGVRPRTSVIFQDYGLLPWRTVEQNAELPLTLAGVGRAERRRRVAPLLEEFGLSDFADLYPHSLSGGMKQRVAIARALVAEPDLLLMDEPFSSLDALTREAAQDFLLRASGGRGMTVVVVTHSIEEAVYLSESVYVMTGRNPGTITARFDVAGRRAATNAATPLEGGEASLEGGAAALGRSRAQDGTADVLSGDFRSSEAFLSACAAVRAALRGAGAVDEGGAA